MLMVIFGAGASYDSAPRYRPGLHSTESRPPLADELFSLRFLSILNQFWQCKPLVPLLDVTGQNKSMEEVLETCLSESDDDPRRHTEFMAIRHYLPRVVADCEEKWLAQHGRITNHLTLLGRIELWRRRHNERVCLVTFHYDTILEEALGDRFSLYVRQIGDYIQRDDYKLIKLHGSTTWFHEVISPVDLSVDDFFTNAEQVTLGPGFAILPPSTFGRVRVDGPALVPAVALPVERKTTFECPQEHLEALLSALPSVTKLILVGWRAREQHFLDILCKSLSASVDAIVVDKSPAHAEELVTWIRAKGVPGTFSPALLSGFTDFIISRTADSFLAR